MLNKIENIIVLLIITTFAFVVLFGVNLSMPTDAQGNMLVCTSMNHAENICMNTIEHITQWQRMFVAINQDDLMIMLAAFIITLLLLGFKRVFDFDNSNIPSLNHYKTEHPDSNLFNYLTEIFARGILQPKLYA